MSGFDAFFARAFTRGVATCKPHPYQRAIATEEQLPDLVCIPSGSGKTAAVVVGWLWRRFRHENAAIRASTPRRLVYCLPMRALVEQVRSNAISWLQNLDMLGGEVDDRGRYKPSWIDGRVPLFTLMGKGRRSNACAVVFDIPFDDSKARKLTKKEEREKTLAEAQIAAARPYDWHDVQQGRSQLDQLGDTLSTLDRLPDLAGVAQAVAVFSGGARARPHPLFPGFGQDGSANYFKTLQSEAKKLASSSKSKGKKKAKAKFQARVGAGELASSSADFRRAVQGRGVAGGFARFHRFVLERRKPGQRQPAVQAVARGVTVVGEGATDLRVLLSRLDESGWLDQLEQPQLPSKKRDEQLLLEARRVHDAIHGCADEPTARSHLAVLHALWRANSLLLTRGDPARVRPLPPLPSQGWEKVLKALFCESPEARIARALASIGWDGWDGWDAKKKKWRPGCPWPIATQVLPVEYGASFPVFCRVPDPVPAQRVPWRGVQPETEVGRVFWRRWLDAARREKHGALPYGATRFAPIADVVQLLRGTLDLRELHRYCSALFVLDWSCEPVGTTPPRAQLPVPTEYAVLRLWIDTNVHPPRDGKPTWDGSIAQCLLQGDPSAIRSACQSATSRLRIVGLPEWAPESTARRARRAVARPAPLCGTDEAARMLLGGPHAHQRIRHGAARPAPLGSDERGATGTGGVSY